MTRFQLSDQLVPSPGRVDTSSVTAQSLSEVEAGLVFDGDLLIGRSLATKRLRSQVLRIGPHLRSAVVSGERGVKKETVARALHAASAGADRPFVVCGAERLEPPGVGRAVDLLLHEARGGTVFARELGGFSPAAQAGLLQLLDANEARGGERVRVIGSVSGSLPTMVMEGVLHAELEKRLGSIELAVVPLGDRAEDIQPIAERLVLDVAEQWGTTPARITDEALDELGKRRWPGNDRELESVLRTALLASDGAVLDRQHLPAAVREAKVETVLEETGAGPMKLQAVVDAHVREVLRRYEGNKLKAAEALGISRSTLYRMLDAAEAGGNGLEP